MGILDGIGLVVLILITVAFCSYCYRCCCVSVPTGADARPRRNRRQKNARRKRRRRQRNRTPNANRPPNSPTSQCNVDLYPEQPPPATMYPPYPSGQAFQGQLSGQTFQSQLSGQPIQSQLSGQPFQGQFSGQPFQGQPYIPHYPYTAVHLSPDPHGQLLPPPYESHMSPQGQCQNFGGSVEPDLSCFSQSPPPPYDTQLCPEPVHTNRPSEESNMKC